MEDAHDVRDDQAPLFGPRAVEHIEGKGMRAALGIENDHIVFPVAGDVVRQELLIEATVRISYGDAGAGGQVRRRQIQQDSTFACSGAPDQKHVFAPGLGRYAELRRAEIIVCVGADGSRFKHGEYLNSTVER